MTSVLGWKSWGWAIIVQHQMSNFELYHGENKLHSMRWCLLCARPTSLVGFLWCQLTETTLHSRCVAPLGTHYSDSGPTSACSHSWTLVSDCCLTPIRQFFCYIMTEQVNFQCNDDKIHFVLDQHSLLDFYSACSLKQQSADRHVAHLGHIIPILSQPVFALSPTYYYCLLSREATNTNLIVFGLTRSGIGPTIYRTGVEHANH